MCYTQDVLSLLYIYMLFKINILFYFNGIWNNAV